ncbi:MAG: response regulator transcription factor [Fluviicola sp.]|nr:response regulator transcription factor [Fluviicola sp.]
MKILLADDHPIFRQGLKSLIESHFNNCEITGVDNGLLAQEELSKNQFDIAILDIDMPEKSGIDVLKYIAENEVPTLPIILTMHNDELFFNEAFNNGAIGYLLKEDSSIEMVECIEKVLSGSQFVSEKIAPYLKNRKTFNSKINTIKSSINSLSKVEYNTLKLVARNKSSKEISELLFVTVKSVENYRSRICRKLDIKGGSNILYKWCVDNQDLLLFK